MVCSYRIYEINDWMLFVNLIFTGVICRTGKVKGIERFLGTVETLEQSLIEVTSGQAKYEHQHRAIVWRMARLPKEGQGMNKHNGLKLLLF